MIDDREKLNFDYARVLYLQLIDDFNSRKRYQKCDLGDGMWSVEELFHDYWKPRYLVDERNQMAVEFMNSSCELQTITTDDIDWNSLSDLPDEVIGRAKGLDAYFPTFVSEYKDGVALLEWQLNPDGRYYMDDDGFGMTNDDEITIHGYVDRMCKPLCKLRVVKDYRELREIKAQVKADLEARK